MNDTTHFLNDSSETEELLHSHNLRKTTCRQGIIEILRSSSEALTENEIKLLLESIHDRTTIYRSFKTLLENNLIHKIVVDNQLVKYALNPKSSVLHEHVHFYCKKCEKLMCIEDSSFEGLTLPKGFKASETEIIVKGTCGKCDE
jgi:Fur family transcriptional regulator, ferric uptake regulator